jgi:hypothetical protein
MSLENTEEHQTFVAENIRQQKTLSGISRCLETAKVRHLGERATAVHAVISALQSKGISFQVSDRNYIKAERAGQPINLQAAIDELLLNDPNIGDRASVAEQVQAGALTVESRSDLRTSKEKSDFIQKFGYDAWAKLPSVRVGPIDTNPITMGRADYNRLNTAQRIEFQKRADVTEEILGQILKRP